MGMSGRVPASVGGAAKAALLGLVGDALAAGWTLGRVCGALEIDRSRVWRWNERRVGGRLNDRAPGGQPDPRDLGLGARRGLGAVRRVGRHRPLAPKARPPRVL